MRGRSRVDSTACPEDPARPVRPSPAALVMMVPVDFAAADLRVTACTSCEDAWWAEVVLIDGLVAVREWHAASCAEWGVQSETGAGDEVAAVPLSDGAVVVHGPGLAGLSVVAAPVPDTR